MKIDTAAVKAAIETVPALATKTFVSAAKRTNGALPVPPYLVIHPSDGIDGQTGVTGPYVTRHPSFTLHIVGSSYNNAQDVTELVKAKFIVNGRGVKLTIAGTNTKPCRWSSPQPTQVDYSVNPESPLIWNIAELDFEAQPTS